MLWPEDFAKHEGVLKDDLIGFVRGTLDRRREPAELVVTKVIPIDRAPAELARGLVVRIHKGVQQPADLERLVRLLRIRPGNLDLYLELLGISQVGRAVYKAGNAHKLKYDDRLLSDLEAVVGSGNVRLLGQRGATTRVQPASAGSDTSAGAFLQDAEMADLNGEA
jgi:DNA polymerase-3 subunit alpha